MPSIDGPQVLEANQRKWAEWIIQTAQKLVPNVRIEIIRSIGQNGQPLRGPGDP